MRRALAQAGYDDVPGNGLYVIGGLALDPSDVSIAELAQDLQVSRLAATQLLEALIARNYLAHVGDPPKLVLTERGRAAAAAQAAARTQIDDELARRVGADDIARTRRTLAALIDIGQPDDRSS
jgi:DNA-binding MarR family transcriptional regulator